MVQAEFGVNINKGIKYMFDFYESECKTGKRTHFDMLSCETFIVVQR